MSRSRGGGHGQRLIFLLRTGSFISAFPRTVYVRWVQALQRAHGQCSFSLNAKDMVTEGQTADAKHTQNAQTLSRDSPVPSLRRLLTGGPTTCPSHGFLVAGSEEEGGTVAGETLLAGKHSSANTTKKAITSPLTGSLRRHSQNDTHTVALIRQGRRVTMCAQTGTRG